MDKGVEPAVPAMLCCAVLLLLVCGSLAVSHPDFWTTSSTSSLETGGRISHLERTRLTGRNMDQMALEGKYQPTGNIDAINQDVTRHSLPPTYFCSFIPLRCPSTVSISRRRSLPKIFVTESLYARFVKAVVEKAVLQALEARNTNIRKKRRTPPTLSAL